MAELLEFEDPIITPTYELELNNVKRIFSEIRNHLYFIKRIYNHEVIRFPYFDDIMRLIIEFNGESKLIIDHSSYTTQNIESNINEYDVDIYNIFQLRNMYKYDKIRYILSKFRDIYSLNYNV